MGRSRGTEPRFDQQFKTLMTNPKVLSRIIGAFIPKLRGLSASELLRMWSEGEIVQMSSEMVSAESGPLFPDLLFKILVPGEGWA